MPGTIASHSGIWSSASLCVITGTPYTMLCMAVSPTLPGATVTVDALMSSAIRRSS